MVYSQSYFSENITTADGLPGNAIRSIYQDSRGCIWIGTDSGLSCWDGENYSIYNTLNGLAGNKVWYIDEDKFGNLWFACFGGGLSKFDGEKFTSYTNNDGLVDNSVRVVKYCSEYDCIAIGTNNSISILKDTTFYNFTAENNSLLKNVIITGILEKDSSIYFYDFSKVHYRIKFENKDPFINRVENDLINNYGISSAYQANNDDYFFGWGREGIIQSDGTKISETKGIGQVFGITKDCLQNTWMASWNGGGISPPGGLFVIKNDSLKRLNEAYNINSILGWSLVTDQKQNNIYYGTLDKGLYLIPPQYFEYYSPEYFGNENLYLNGLKVDNDNNIWFFSDSSFYKWDRKSYVKKDLDFLYNLRIQAEKTESSEISLFTRLKKLKKEYLNQRTHITDIETDAQNNTWLTSSILGSFKFRDNRIKNAKFISQYIYMDIAFTSKDTLFQCDGWSRVLKKFYDHNTSNKSQTYIDELNPIFSKFMRTYNDEVWVSSRISGVFLYKSGEFITLTEEDSTVNKNINDICFDADGYAYLGGSDGRIEVFAPSTRKKIFEIKLNGNSNSVIWMNVAEDMLFAGFSDGLRVFKLSDIKNNEIKHRFFSKKEGYEAEIVNGSDVDNNGNLWLATNKGLMKINTKLFIKCKIEPLTTVIKKVEIFNKEVDWSKFADIDKWSKLPLNRLRLQPSQNHISIYYQTYNFSNQKGDFYYYKLDGIDKDWVGPTDKKHVVYPYLNYGDYKFIVKSENQASGLTSNVAEFQFEILTPWYKQIWFHIIVFMALIAFLFIAYKQRINMLSKKEEEKRKIMQQISELEIKALQAQMNPHFLFNSINSIQNYILDNNVDKALGYLSSFSKVVRKTLEFADKKFVRLNDVLSYLQHYIDLEKMRFDDMFNYEVVLDEEIDADSVMMPPMILQPIIENSIKHGIHPLNKKGTIRIEIFRFNKESIKIIIEDNGIGREKASKINNNRKLKNDSKGLKITKERLDILNRNNTGTYDIKIIDLYDDEGAASGTRVEIIISMILD